VCGQVSIPYRYATNFVCLIALLLAM